MEALVILLGFRVAEWLIARKVISLLREEI